ncbi:HIT family protein [Rathayibacter sp. VKM Ac-2754]|uniref:HIT family protein n=1 Tax=Rathayibacter sp. VKM Ac-2754 TaxID=2609251 RepID=UPI001359911B|nr:hypothetical protein [Rathayibacter sp. VKM Ac-2754]MWV60755.1 hypothetical protein [Rathayibacter sp. VKM Ac-2754]
MTVSVLADPECVFCRSNPRKVWESRGLAVCSDPAPLSPGHLLVYTTEHHPSAAYIGVESAATLDLLVEALSTRIRSAFGDVVLFEHGRTGHCLRSRPGERMCHHMHVHLIPGALDLRTLAALGQSVVLSSWTDVIDLGSQADGYAVVGGGSAPLVFYPVSHSLPPHYLRTVIAEARSTPELADWETVLSNSDAAEAAPRSHEIVLELVDGLTIATSC